MNAADKALTIEQHNAMAEMAVGVVRWLQSYWRAAACGECAEIGDHAATCDRGRAAATDARQKAARAQTWQLLRTAVVQRLAERAGGGADSDVEQDSFGFVLNVRGIAARVHVEVNAVQSGGHWALRHDTGALRITVGDYGDKTTYPAGKSGFRYAKIADAICDRAYRRGREIEVSAAAESARGVSEVVAERVRAAAGVTYPTDVNPVAVVGRELQCRVTVDVCCTEEQALRLLAVVVEVRQSNAVAEAVSSFAAAAAAMCRKGESG